MTCNKFHTEHPQILGTTAHNLVAQATWRPQSVHLCVCVCVCVCVWVGGCVGVGVSVRVKYKTIGI